MVVDRYVLKNYNFLDKNQHELESCEEYNQMMDVIESAKEVFDWIFIFGVGVDKEIIREKLSKLGNELNKIKWLGQ